MPNNLRSKYIGHPVICNKCQWAILFANFCPKCGVELIMDNLTPIKVGDSVKGAMWYGRAIFYKDDITYKQSEWTPTNYDGPMGCSDCKNE